MSKIRPFFAAWLLSAPGILQPAASQAAGPPVATRAPPVISGLDGDWDGTLTVDTTTLRLVVHISTVPGTGTVASLDSIDQGATGLPIDSISKAGDRLRFDVDLVQGRYEGLLSADSKTIAGSWTQSGYAIPLMLTHRAVAGQAQVPAAPQGKDRK